MTNLEKIIKDAEEKLPESGQPEQLRESLKEVIKALKIIAEELSYIK